MQKVSKSTLIFILTSAFLGFAIFDTIANLLQKHYGLLDPLDTLAGEEFIELLFMACGALATYLAYDIYKEQRDLRIALDKATHKNLQDIETMTGEFQTFVHSQFEDWTLSKTEKQIAELLLAGKSLKEIGEIRFVSERTVRNHANSIYKKSQLPGRHALSAFFISSLGIKPPSQL